MKQVPSRLSGLAQERNEFPKVLDDQMRPCCSHTGKHLCSSMEDLSEVGSTEEDISAHLFAKVGHCVFMQVGWNLFYAGKTFCSMHFIWFILFMCITLWRGSVS